MELNDGITDDEVRVRIGEQRRENVFRERRLYWLYSVIPAHTTAHTQYREVPGFSRGRGRPRTDCRGTVKKDLHRLRLTWEETEAATLSRQE